MRNKLIEAIIELSGDEYETRESLIELATKSEEELVDLVINVARFYQNEFND